MLRRAAVSDCHAHADVGVMGIRGKRFHSVDDPVFTIPDCGGACACGVGTGFGLGQRPAAEPLARRQSGQIFPLLLFVSRLADVVRTERSVGSDNDPHRAIHAGKFLDDDGVFHIAEARAAVSFRNNGAHVAQPTQFADDFEGEGLRLVPLHYVRRDLSRSEFPHGAPQLDLFGRVFEVHNSDYGSESD